MLSVEACSEHDRFHHVSLNARLAAAYRSAGRERDAQLVLRD